MFSSLLESLSSVERGAASCGFCYFWFWFGPRRPCCPRRLAGGDCVPIFYWSCTAVPVIGPHCPAADLCLCLDSPISGPWGARGARIQLFAALAAGLPSLPGPLPPPEKGTPTSKWTLAGRALTHTHGQIWLLPGHRLRQWRGQSLSECPALALSTRWSCLRSWERASGFGPWDSQPLGVPLAISPTAVHTQDRLGQGRGPAGPYRVPCHVTDSGLTSGPGMETWILGLLCQVLAM